MITCPHCGARIATRVTVSKAVLPATSGSPRFLEIAAPRLVEIAKRAARNEGLNPELLAMKTRVAEVVTARHAAMYVAHLEGYSVAAIGRFFNRQGTAVRHAISKGEAACGSTAVR